MYAQTSEPNRPPSSQEPVSPSNVSSGNSGSTHPQLHVHMLCPCAHPYYSGFRPPVLSLPLHQLPRPYLQHYQYTQYNMNPYNFPIHGGAAAAAAAAVATTSSNSGSITHSSNAIGPSAVLTEFGPPPRDRRNMLDDVSHDTVARDDDILTEITHHLQQQDVSTVVGSVEVESFTKYLEEGLIQAEKIAIRNQHRPCFKNIQNLCNRTRGEILKTSSTYSNIHSQGIPWATKDFIYAFVRLINCWHMLKGYLDSKSGTLGNIDRELTAEFKATYSVWEKDTRDLAEHMVRVFTNLDNNVSTPNPNLIPYKKHSQPPNLEPPTMSAGNLTILQQAPTNQSDSLLNKATSATRLLAAVTIDPPIPEQPLLSESTETSPREEDSDNESRVYMKPGSYNIPKKTNSSDNSSRSYEFLETAQNVSSHYRKAAAAAAAITKDQPANQFRTPGRNENDWRNAISASSNLINLNQSSNNTSSIFGHDLLNSLIDSNAEQRGDPGIERWLEQSNFDKDSFIVDDGGGFLGGDSSSTLKPITLLQRKGSPIIDRLPKDFLGNYLGHHFDQQHNLTPNVTCDSSNALYRNRKLGALNGGTEIMIPAPISSVNHMSNASHKVELTRKVFECEKGGLYSATVCTLERLIKVLEQEDLARRMTELEPQIAKSSDFMEQSLPQTLSTIWLKIQGRKYVYVNECIRDIKNIIASASLYYENNIGVLNEIENFSCKLQECLDSFFPGFDFSGITGGMTEDVGPLLHKSEDIAQHKV